MASQCKTLAENTNLPAILYSPFLHGIAYLEILLGLALLLGIRTKYSLALLNLTYVALAFGLMLLGNTDGVARIGIFLLLTSAALYFVRHNKCELLR